jgi:hypothetical protein
MYLRKLSLVSAVGTAVLAISVVGASRGASGTACRGPDSFSAAQVNHLKSLMRSADNLYVSFRQRVHLPAASGSSVQLVTDSTLCARALGAWNTPDSTNAPHLDSLYVIRVGMTYDAISPAGGGSEWNQHMVMDSSFSRVSDYLY